MSEQKKYKFHVNGMHCHSCVVMTESELQDMPGVKSAKSTLASKSVEVTGDFGGKTEEEIASELSEPLKKHGYSLSLEKQHKQKRWKDFRFALPIAAVFLGLFVLLQKMGIVNLVDATEISYGTSFVIGIIASLSTCMAVVGGLVLSMSAVFAKEGDKVRPQLLFHVGRIIAFFVLGGLIGAVGANFQLNVTGTFVLSLIIGAVMLILGLNLLDVFDFAKRLQPSMPKFLAKRAVMTTKLNHSLTPFLVGIATFFLPCGFTQSMQIFTLSTGSFMSGALTMFFYALGTLPVLALVSFSSLSIHTASRSSIFFKTVGLIVIMFAMLNLINALVVVGILPPIFSF